VTEAPQAGAAGHPPARSDRARAGGAGVTTPLACAASIALHAALLLGLSRARPTPAPRDPPVEVEIREVPRPAEPPGASVEPPLREPTLPAPRLALRAPRAKQPPRAALEPPPTAVAPSEPAKAPPIRIGVSMSSTTAAGGFAVPVGNTLHGEPPHRAEEPSSVLPYRSEGYLPATEVTSLPVPIPVDIPRSEYPEEARRLGFEGMVKLRLLVDEQGRVREAKLLHDPGHGLGAQALRNAKRYLRFRPALREGRPVATEIPFTMAFELD
jgi:protein TonB